MRAVLVGEAMLELSGYEAAWRLGYGGDTLNTAIHMARAGVETAYLTALGHDAFSHGLKRAWAAEGLDTSLILTDRTRSTGLYAISTDDEGERSFTYWRGESAARRLFSCEGIERALERAGGASLLVYSLISLAILPPRSRRRLLSLARQVREGGGRVAFDSNYRPQLWRAPEEARMARDEAIMTADIGLPTFEDEALLSGQADADAIAGHWEALGCAETVVKLGARGCRLPDGRILPPPRVLTPVDTAGAGDAFNGGYLIARLRGAGAEDAAHAGHDLAGWCVMRRGAIPEREVAGGG